MHQKALPMPISKKPSIPLPHEQCFPAPEPNSCKPGVYTKTTIYKFACRCRECMEALPVLPFWLALLPGFNSHPAPLSSQ